MPLSVALAIPPVWNAVCNSRSIKGAVRAATRIFEKHGVPEPAASAEYLAVSSFQIVSSRTHARSIPVQARSVELDAYVKLCQERKERRTPVQYLVGEWDFHNICLLVRPPVLIPRPETEELVEHVLSDVKVDNARILDVGCGSGAILLAALHARPNWLGLGLDISEEAVSLTHANMKHLGLSDRAEVRKGSVVHSLNNEQFDVIVSNPPYILTKDMDSLEREVKSHEDHRALCGGTDGLDVVREILENAPSALKRGGSLWLEVDTSHPELLKTMKLKGLVFENKFDDLFGNPRFCQFRKT